MRLRILFGTFALILGLILYAFGILLIATLILPENLILETLFYGVAGLAWLWPAAKLTYWMQDMPPPPSRF